MRTALLLAALAAAAPARKPAEKAAPLAPVLREGRWTLPVGGVLCNACTRAAVEEVKRIPGVAKAGFDFEDGYMSLTVARGAQVRTSRLERALRNAGRRADLGTRFTLAETRYEGPDLEGTPPPRKPVDEDALKRPAAPERLEP